MIIRALALALLLILSACAVGPSDPASCTLQPVATLDLLPGSPDLVVLGKLNQSEARFLLDTGAEATQVSPEAVRTHGLAHGRGQTRITGIGGSFVAPTVFANIELGGYEVRRTVPAAPIPFAPQDGHAYDGVIGADLLSAYDLEVSIPERHVRLWRTSQCGGDYVRWAGRHWTVPLKRTTGGRLFVPVSVDGTALTAILDTGASGSLLGMDAGRQAGANASAMAGDPVLGGRGIDGNAIKAHRHRFASLGVGPELFHNPVIPVSETNLTQGDMLLGLDWLRGQRVWISWDSRQVFAQRRQDIAASEPH